MGCFLRPAVSSLVRLPLTRMRRLAMIAGVLLLVSGVSLWAGTEPEEQGIKTIYIIPTSHYDLGFLAPPEEILTHMKRHIDEVIANATLHVSQATIANLIGVGTARQIQFALKLIF